MSDVRLSLAELASLIYTLFRILLRISFNLKIINVSRGVGDISFEDKKKMSDVTPDRGYHLYVP